MFESYYRPALNTAFSPASAPAEGVSETEHINKGLYAYINAADNPELQKNSDEIFGRTAPFTNSEADATLIGRRVASSTGYRSEPIRYLRDNKLAMPENWSGENAQLYTLIGQNYIAKAQEHYNNAKSAHQKQLADAQKDITDSFNRLPEAIADSVLRADGITSHTALDKDLLQSLTKYNQGENALTAQKRAALAWQYIAPAFENVDHLQDTNRRLLLDIANALSDEKGQLDPHALAAFVMLTDKKATELQSTNSEFWADFADKFQNFWRTTDDQIKKNGGLAYSNWRDAQGIIPERPAYYGDERVEKLYGYMNQAINTAISPSEKAEWYAKLLSEMGGLLGESIVPMTVGVAASAMTGGLGGGAFLAATAGYGTGVAASAPSTINNAIGNAYIKGVINPELYGTIEGIGQAAAENIGGPATSLKLFTKTAGKLTNYAASRAAGSRFLANQYARTTLNYLTAGAFESVTELAEEELGGFIGSKLNALARSMGFEVSPQAYQLGETLKDMKSHEVAAIFGYSYTLGLFGVPANFRDARNFAKNTDNLLKAGHTAKAARDIQLKVFQTEDKISEIIANPSLTQEQKDAAIRKEEQSLASYQQSKFINNALSDPKLRARLKKEGRDLRDEIEVLLDVEHEADLQILKEHNILEAVVIPGEKYKVSIYEPGELQQDGTRAPGKITTQEWSRMQLTNWLMLQKDTRIEQDLRAFQSLLLSHAHAQSATVEETKTHFQNLGENRPLAALGELHKNGITPAFFQKAAKQALQLQLLHQQEGMTPQQAAQQPSPDFQGLSLGQVQSLATAASQRAEQEIATTGALQNITEDTAVEYGGINLLTADGTALIKYVAGRATILDMLEERFEADIKQRTRGNQTLLNQLAETLLHIQSHLPGNIQLLDPKKKGNYTKSDFVEAYSKIAIGAFLYNEKNLPINAAGHRLIQNIGRAVDTTRMFQTIGNAWLTYANSPEGKAHLEAGGRTIADIMQQAGFTFSNQLASARATAQQRAQVLEARNYQPDIEQEVKALMDSAQQEQQLAEINQQEAKEPITIPADQSITGKEITVETQSEHGTSVPTSFDLQSQLDKAHNRILSGTGNTSDYTLYLHYNPMTHAEAIQNGICTINQHGNPSAAYTIGRQRSIFKDGKYSHANGQQRDVLTGEVSIAHITHSPDVPQFKRNKAGRESDQSGVVYELPGEYRQHDPIHLWQRTDGTLVVISGRHRLAKAIQAGASYIPATVFPENAQRDTLWARMHDFEQNVLDNQASVADTAVYVAGTNPLNRKLTEKETQEFTRPGSNSELGTYIGLHGSDDLLYCLTRGFISPDYAHRIAKLAPDDADVQQQAIGALVQDGKGIQEAENSANIYREIRDSQTGELMFESDQQEEAFNRFLAKYAANKIREIGRAQRPHKAAKSERTIREHEAAGIKFEDAAANRATLQQLTAEQEKWRHPRLHPECMEEARKAFDETDEAKQTYMDFDLFSDTANFSIIGPRAKTWDNYKDRIFYGLYDGIPRVELDSSKFRYIPASKRARNMSEEEMQRFLNNEMLDVLESIYTNNIDRNDEVAIKNEIDNRFHNVYINFEALYRYLEDNSSFNKEKAVAFINNERICENNANLKNVWRLEDVFKASELYNAYPHLKDIPVYEYYKEDVNDLGGSKGNLIAINNNKEIPLIEQKKTIIHEVQHVIQNYEGFAVGTSVQFAGKDLALALREAYKEAAHLVERRARVGKSASFTPEEERTLERYNTLKKLSDKYIGNQPWYTRLAIKFIPEFYPEIIGDSDLYELSAGEIEAVAVEKRMDMNEEDRIYIPFNDSLKTLPSSAFVAFKNAPTQKTNPVTATSAESSGMFTDGVLEAQNAIVTTPSFSIKALHASPHNFRKFSTDFMGSGEGAQAYGWGLYFATHIGINKHYFNLFNAHINEWNVGGAFVDDYDFKQMLKKEGLEYQDIPLAYVRSLSLVEDGISEMKQRIEGIKSSASWKAGNKLSTLNVARAEKGIKALEYLKANRIYATAAVNYQVEMDVDDSNLLMWNERYSGQQLKTLLGDDLFERIYDEGDEDAELLDNGEGVYMLLISVFGNKKLASKELLKHGVKGIRYRDAASQVEDDGTYNYVIFSGDDIKITAVNETGIWSMDEGWEEYTDPTANFSIRAANPATLNRFTADPLGERIVHTVRTEARRYARVLGDKTPQEQAMNAIASAESIINAVDKYLHRPDKPVSRRHRNQLTKLRSIIEKYAQIIASGTPRSFKRISPAEQQELQAAIAELEAAELESAETAPALLIEDDKRMNKRTREARSREHHRAIVREAAKGRVYKVLAAMLDTAADALDDYLKDQLLTKLHRLTATVAIKRTPSKRLKGKMTAPMYRELEQAVQLMAYSTRQKEDAIDTILTAHETLAQAIASNEDNLTRGNTLLIELAHQLEQEGTPVTAQTLTAALAAHEARVAIFADITSKNYEQTRTAANAIYYIIRYGRALWQQKHEAREAEIQTYLSHFLANTTAQQGKANAIRNMLDKFKWTDALSLNATMNAAQTLLALSSYEPLRPIIQQVLNNYATASVARQKHLQEMRKQELYLYARIIGIKPATEAGYSDKQLREISDKFDTFYAENNQTIQTDITVTWQERNADGILETHTSDPLSLTKWEALNLILTYRQQDYQTNAQLHGYTDEILDKLEKLIGTDLMDFGNGIQQALINDGTIAVYEEREGIPMRSNPLYWPGNININTLNTTREEPLVNPYHPAAGHDFLHTRVRHRNEIAHLNAFTVWRKAVADRANYIYSDPVTSHLESLLARQQFAGRLKTLIGEGLYRQLKATIAEIKNASWQETSLQDVNNTIVATAFASKSLAVLSGNPSSLVRQLSAVANAGLMPGLTPDKYLQYAIGLKQGQGHIGISGIMKLDSFTTRQRDNAYVNEMLAMGNDVKFSRLMDWAKAGMNAMDKLDLLANAFSAAIVYNHKYDELKTLGTLTEDQIKKQCENAVAVYTKLLAQPLNRTDKSALYWQLGNHALGRAVLFMSSESINKIGMLRANYIRMRNQGKNPAAALGILLGTMGITVGLTAALTEAALAILTGSLPDDDDNIAAWATALWLNASYGQYLSSLPLIGGVSDSFLSPYGGYLSGDLRLPGIDTIRYGSKLIEMLTDNKTYTAAQWEKETTRFMRDFTAVLGFAGGAYSRWQWYSNAAAFSHSLTAALNALYPIARGVEAHTSTTGTSRTSSTRTRTRKPRRSKSKIEQWLTPDRK